MNCPLCSSPLLFGATSCPCGYNVTSSSPDELPIELSYWEGLRAYWRIYWPTQLLGLITFFAIAVTSLRRMPALVLLLLQVALGALFLFLCVQRICSRAYQGFSLVAVEIASGATTQLLPMRWRAQACVFLWWRQILAGMFASLLAMPLNALLSIMGLRLTQWIAVLTGVLVIGPILLKMLIGHQFEEFRLEARRQERHTGEAEPVEAPAANA